MQITVMLAHVKSAPKSHAYEARTEDGILVKMWIPHRLVAKPLADIEAIITFPEGKKKGKKKRKQEEVDEDDD